MLSRRRKKEKIIFRVESFFSPLFFAPTHRKNPSRENCARFLLFFKKNPSLKQQHRADMKNHIKITYIMRCKRRGYFTLKEIKAI